MGRGLRSRRRRREGLPPGCGLGEDRWVGSNYGEPELLDSLELLGLAFQASQNCCQRSAVNGAWAAGVAAEEVDMAAAHSPAVAAADAISPTCTATAWSDLLICLELHSIPAAMGILLLVVGFAWCGSCLLKALLASSQPLTRAALAAGKTRQIDGVTIENVSQKLCLTSIAYQR